MGTAESKKKFDLQEEEFKFQTIYCSSFKYTGNTKNNLFHGEGEYQRIVDNKIHYTVYGVWENHKLISYKIIYELSGNIYEGEIDTREYVTYAYSDYGGKCQSLTETVNYTSFDYRPHGKGKMYHPDGSCSLENGVFNRGLFTGHGKKKDTDGNVYVGDWVDGLYHGKGRIVKKIVDKETKTGKFVPQEGYFHKGDFVGETITDEERELFFPNLTEETNQTTSEVQPDAPEAEQEGEQEGKQEVGEQELELKEDPKEEPEEVGESEEEQELEPEEVGEEVGEEVSEPEEEQVELKKAKIMVC
jgi:hypothetical protein